MNHKILCLFIFIMTVISIPIANASQRHDQLESARSQKESALKLLDEETILLNETLDEIRQTNRSNQSTAELLEKPIVGINLERALSDLKVTVTNLESVL